jgi:hypothetical protein
MNVPNYLDISLVEIIWTIPLLFLVFATHRYISQLFFGMKFTSAQSSLIGLAINGAALSTLVSFNMLVASIYLWTVTIALISLQLKDIVYYLIKKNYVFRFNIMVKKSSSFVLVFCATFIIQLISFNSRDVSVINAHWAYYFGLPSEMLNGSYPDRIRIHDNYPIEYPKFHFFYSSQLAILMRLIGKIDFSDFALTRIFFVSVICMVIWDIVGKSVSFKKSLSLFFGSILLAILTLSPNLLWSNSSTNIASILFFIIFFIFLIKGDVYKSTVFIALFSLTSARSVFPAVLLLLFIFCKHYSSYRVKSFGSKKLLFIILILFNWVTMFVSGEQADQQFIQTLKEQLVKPYFNFVTPSWLGILSPGLFPTGIFQLESSVVPNKTFMNWSILVLTTFVLSFSPIIKSNHSKNFKLSVCLIIFWITPLVITYLDLPKATQLTSLSYNFAVPTLAVYILSPKNVRPYTAIFILSSCLQLILFSGGFAVPNWALIEWLWIILIVYGLNAISKKSIVILSTFLIATSFLFLVNSSVKTSDWYLPQLDDSTTHKIDFNSIGLVNKSFTCNQVGLLLQALKGERVYFDSNKSDRYSITKLFVPKNTKFINYYECEEVVR